jgi:hypothetical protein
MFVVGIVVIVSNNETGNVFFLPGDGFWYCICVLEFLFHQDLLFREGIGSVFLDRIFN